MSYLTEKCCKELNVEFKDIIPNSYGHQMAHKIINFYRIKDTYYLYKNNLKYDRIYYYHTNDYENIYKNGFNIENSFNIENGLNLFDLRNEKNNILNVYVSNLYFYRLDNNITMTKVASNLLNTIYSYISYLDDIYKNNSEFKSVVENAFANDILYAFDLYYTMLNKEKFLISPTLFDKILYETC